MSDDFDIRLRRRFERTEEALSGGEFTACVQGRLHGFQGGWGLARVVSVVIREMAGVFRRLARIPHLAAALLGTLALAGWALIG